MPAPASSAPEELIVGTYTERLPHVDGQAEGILACTFADGAIGCWAGSPSVTPR